MARDTHRMPPAQPGPFTSLPFLSMGLVMAPDLNARKAAEVLGILIYTVRKLADDGVLRHRRTAGGHRRFAEVDLVAHRALRESGERPRAAERADVWAVATRRLLRAAEADLGPSSPWAARFAAAREALSRR